MCFCVCLLLSESMHVLYETSFVWRNQITFDVGILFFDLLLVVIPFKQLYIHKQKNKQRLRKFHQKKKPEKKKVRYVSRRTALLLLLLLQKNSTSVLSHQVISYNYVNMSPCAAFVYVCASVFVSIYFCSISISFSHSFIHRRRADSCWIERVWLFPFIWFVFDLCHMVFFSSQTSNIFKLLISLQID